MHSPLESLQHWYHLTGIADAAPLTFLRDGWNWLVKACERFHRGYNGSVLNYYEGSCSALDEDRDHPEPPILSTFWTAIDLVAENHPDEFIKITRQSWSSENAVLLCLNTRGLIFVAKHNPQVCLEYLVGDDRRFALGGWGRRNSSVSISLIAELAPRLDPSELEKLYQRILVWSQYRKDADLVNPQDEWDREARVRLLNAIPESVRAPEMASFIESEKQSLPGWNREHHYSKSGFVRRIPPMSKESMLSASDADILSAIEGSRENSEDRSLRRDVDGGWEEPGGPETVANEIADMAKDNPKRASDIALLLIAEGKQDIAASALRTLSDTSLPDEEIFHFVRQAATHGVSSEELRSSLSYMLYKRCDSPEGLPDDLCKLIREWLALPWDSKHRAFLEHKSPKEKEDIQSLLWTPLHGMVDTDKAFWPLLAITQGYLLRDPVAAILWQDTLEENLPRDISDRTWAAFCSDLKWLRLKDCDHERAQTFVSNLFVKFPSLREGRDGLVLVSNLTDVVSREFLQHYLTSLRESENPKAMQGYGELLPLIALRDQKNEWAVAILNDELKSIKTGTSNESTQIGLAFTAAQLWDNPPARLAASRILCSLIPKATDDVLEAAHTVFWSEHDFADEEPTILLLTALAENPSAFKRMRLADLGEHLVGLVIHQPKLILDVCNAIISVRDIRDLFEIGQPLVKIAMTLQRVKESRDSGLTLLESLLRLGLDDAFSVLVDIDIRPSGTRRSMPPQRRRRGRKRKAKSS